MGAVSVQVLAYAPTAFRHCQHCEVAFDGIGLGERIHRSEAAEALPDDLLAEYQRISEWVHELVERHERGLKLSVVDAASIEGVWKSLRHRVRRYPAVVVDGTAVDIGGDFSAVDALIDQRVGAKGAA